MSVADVMRLKLSDRLDMADIDIRDDSHLHAGHAGAREGGESHFHLTIASRSFEGLSRVARQRLVNEILRDELAGPVHALAMKLMTPEEAETQTGADR